MGGWNVIKVGSLTVQSAIVEMPTVTGASTGEVALVASPPLRIPGAAACVTIIGGGLGDYRSTYDVNVRAEVGSDGLLSVVIMRGQDSFLPESAQYRVSAIIVGGSDQ